MRGIVFKERNNMNTDDNLFEYIFDEDTMEGVYELSLVLEPAISVEALQFANEEKQDWKVSDVEKQMLISPVLIPNQKLWRNSIAGKQGYVFVREETIEKLQQNFAKNKYGDKSTFEHQTDRPIENLYVAESWIIEDPLNDKANALGFKDLPKGTWMVSIKIDNAEVWNDYVKTGKVKGISIDALLGAKRVDNNELINFKMNKKTINEIVAMAIQKVALEAELKEFKISDELSYFANDLVLEAIITDAEGLAMMDMDFIFEGNKYSTDEMGAIKEIEAVEKEEEAVIEEVKLEEEPVILEAPVEVDPTIELLEKIAELEANKLELETKIEDLEAKNVKLEADIVFKESEKVEMSKSKPASKGISNAPIEKAEFKKSDSVLDAFRRNK